MKRVLTPYESTQLARHGATAAVLSDTTPIEYVTGVAEFCGVELAVNPAVLIPRVETEGLVELALECLSEKMLSAAQVDVIDVGTGSGAVIAILAKHLEQSPVPLYLSASDVSQEALSAAKENIEKLCDTPVKLLRTDLLTDVSGPFDLIVANLPYIPSEAVKKLDKIVINHEPITALDGGGDGFELIRALLRQSSTKLKSSGSVILELDTSHTESFFDEFEDTFNITFFMDCFDRHRFARLDLKN